MDMVFILGIAALWGVTALVVFAFKKLEKPTGARA